MIRRALRSETLGLLIIALGVGDVWILQDDRENSSRKGKEEGTLAQEDRERGPRRIMKDVEIERESEGEEAYTQVGALLALANVSLYSVIG